MCTDQRQRCTWLQLESSNGSSGASVCANHAPGNGLRLPGYLLPGEKSAARCAAGGDLRFVTALRVLDPLGFIRKLDAAIQRFTEYAGRCVRRFLRSVVAAQ